MAYSKTFLLLGLLLAVVLIMSSEVSARELTETGQNQVSVEDAKDGYGGNYGHGKGSYGHGKGPYGHGKGKGKGSYGHGKGKGKGKGKPPGHGDAAEDVEDETEN